MRDNFDFDSNLTDESDLQSEKHSSHKISIDAGTTISINRVSRNVSHSIRDHFDPDSNVTD
jgi:hypothetical protein